jgi:hypothetical protein
MRKTSIAMAALAATTAALMGCTAPEPKLDLTPDVGRETNVTGVSYHRVEYRNEDGETQVLDCVYFRSAYSGGPWCEHVADD